MKSKKKVIVAGHICLDITPVFQCHKVQSIEEILTPGKLVQIGNADVHTGGAVANTGLAMKILGADVSLMGKVGKDSFGRIIKNILDSYEAGDGLIEDESVTTSYTVALAIPGIDRMFLHHSGANDSFYEKDIPEEQLADTALFHFGYPSLMQSMYEQDGAELIHMMQTIQGLNVATSLDLAAVDDHSKAGQADWKKILTQVLPYVDFFVPSVEELCYMLDRPRFEEWQRRAKGKDITEVINIETDVLPLAKQCLLLGCKVLLIKCGAPGIFYATASADKIEQISKRIDLDVTAWADQTGFEKSYVPEKILSGTGAGDTSIAAFLTSMLEGCPPQKCLQYATATGACCVAAYDALSGLKSLAEIQKKIDTGWQKNQ